jgi:hypothetical protein
VGCLSRGSWNDVVTSYEVSDAGLGQADQPHRQDVIACWEMDCMNAFGKFYLQLALFCCFLISFLRLPAGSGGYAVYLMRLIAYRFVSSGI